MIAGYIVTARLGGAKTTGTSSSINVASLTNASAYIFTVIVTHSSGISFAPTASAAMPTVGNQTVGFTNPDSQILATYRRRVGWMVQD